LLKTSDNTCTTNHFKKKLERINRRVVEPGKELIFILSPPLLTTSILPRPTILSSSKYFCNRFKHTIHINIWMQKTKEELYKQIKDIKTKQDFEIEIKKVKKEYDELLDDNAAALLIVDELGRNKQNIVRIADLKPEMECTVIGKINDINKSRNFNRKNGSTGHVINLELKDDTETCGLALWDKDVELVKNKTIQIGTRVKVINGYTKNGFNGIELNVGRWSLLEIEPDEATEFKKEKSESNIIKGKLVKIEPTRAFFKENGEFGFVTNMTLEINGKIKQITVWGEKVKEIQKLKTGDTIEIDNINTKQNNGTEEIHLNSKGTFRKI
jgi:ssDNA-binding replication factor A large subunit